MRIAQVAPLAESVPPKLYGGTEGVIAWLIEELVALGHQVTLFASGDSRTRATLVPALPRALRLARPGPYGRASGVARRGRAASQELRRHTDWLHQPVLRRLGVPFVTASHGRLDLPGLPVIVARFPDARFVSISHKQRASFGTANWLGTVYHGLPVHSLRPVYERGSYLAFLGRLSKDKGPEAAIRIARAAGIPLRMAAKLPKGERGYFKEQLGLTAPLSA